ncbi:MAG: CtpF protein [Ahrensia sp.]|nr:CtpF protein [Ahrensia sp.]
MSAQQTNETDAFPEVQPDDGMSGGYRDANPHLAQSIASTNSESLSDIRPVPRVAIQAFCESQQIAAVIEGASTDRRMGKAHVKVQLGGIPAAVDFYQTATTPNLIIVESRLEGDSLMSELGKLAEVCDESTNVVVIGHRNDVHTYRELISQGVSEYLVAPISMADVMEVVSTLFVSPDAEPLGQTIAFIGARGGAGSSTIAHNASWAIANNHSSDVVLADFDLAFGTANIDFDQDPAQGVADAIYSSEQIDDTYLDKLLSKCSQHLSLLAAPSNLDREYDFVPSDFTNLIEVAQRSTPHVLIDLPHGWTGWIRHVLSLADKVVITATPDLASLRNTKNLVDTLVDLRPNDDKPLLVLNQCNVPKRPEISVAEFCSPLDIEPTIVVPFEPGLFGLASNNGQMISETDPKHDVAASFATLAQVVTGRREIQPVEKSSVSSLLSRFTRKR